MIMGEVNKVLLEAGAGAGKTTRLVSMIIENIEKGQATLSEIVAITFTEAATTELKERFQKKLLERSDELKRIQNPNDDEKEALKNIEKAVGAIDTIAISTIHGFCNKLLSEFPFDVNLPLDRVVVTNEDEDAFLEKLYYEAANIYFSDPSKSNIFNKTGFAIGDVLPTFKAVFKLDNIEFMRSIDTVSDDEFNSTVKELSYIYNEYVSIASNTRNAVSEYEKSNSIRNAVTYKDGFVPLSHNRLYGAFTYNNFKLLNGIIGDETAKGTTYNIFSVPRDTDKAHRGAINAIKDKAKEQFDEHVSALKSLSDTYLDYIDSEIRVFLEGVYKIARGLKKQANTITNDDILTNTLTLLKNINSGHIQKRMDYKFCYIDEFQDTDPLQVEIFNTLASIIEKQSDGKITLYFIGDPKQSIYHFRGADLECYLHVRREIDEKMRNDNSYSIEVMRDNYRSNQKVLEFVNDFFGKDEEYFGSFQYTPMTLGRKDEDGIYKSDVFSGVYLHTTSGDTLTKAEDVRQAEAEWTASFIDTLVKNKRQIYSKDEGVRDIRYSDFMLITPKTTSHVYYVNALKKRGISVNLQGRAEFKGQIFDVFKGMILYITENQNYAEIYILEALFKKDYTEITDEMKSQAIPLFNFVNACRENGVNYLLTHIDDFINIVFDITGTTEDISMLYQVVEEIKNNVIASYADFMKTFDAITSKQCERQLSLCSNSDDVRILNLHKSKGLQANVVMLLDAPTKNSGPDERKHVFMDENGKNHFEVFLSSAFGKTMPLLCNNKLDEENTREKLKLDEEYKRLLYVAATRAKEALVVFGNEKTSKDGKKIDDKSYWYSLYKSISESDKNELHYDVDASKLSPNANNEPLNPRELISKETIDESIIAELKKAKTKHISPSKADDEKLIISKVDDDDVDDANIAYDTAFRVNDDLIQQNVTTEGVTTTDVNAKDRVTIIGNECIFSPTVRGTIIHLIFELAVNYITKDENRVQNRSELINNNHLREELVSYAVKSTLSSLRLSNYGAVSDVIKRGKTLSEYDNILTAFLTDDEIQESIKTATEVYTEYPFKYISKRSSNSGVTEVTEGIIDLLLVFDDNGIRKYQPYDYKSNEKSDNTPIPQFEAHLYSKYKGQFELYKKALTDMLIGKGDGTKNVQNVEILPVKLYHLYK